MSTSNEEIEEFRKNGFLTTHMVLNATSAVGETEKSGSTMTPVETAVHEKFLEIKSAIDQFNVEVWLLWLYSRQANEPDHKYLEANASNVNMLVGSMAGRCMITLRWRDRDTTSEEAHHFVSLIGAERLTLMTEYSPTVVHGLCGFQGIGMNGDKAIELIEEAVRVSKELANVINKASEIVTFG